MDLGTKVQTFFTVFGFLVAACWLFGVFDEKDKKDGEK